MEKTKLQIEKNGLKLNEKPFYLASGDMHYFRFFRDGWKRRLQLMKDFGLTAVQTYVPWNLHEPEEGEYRFDGNLDLGAFLQMCDDIGLKVMLRPSGYMCSEWELGGLPYWLLNKGVAMRTSDSGFVDCLRRYYEKLCAEFVPYLSTNGGPVIAVAVENEYGSFSDDSDYMHTVADMLTDFGVDVPFFTADGASKRHLINGSSDEWWSGVDVHELCGEALEEYREFQSDKPMYIAEFWAGRGMQYGGFFLRQSADNIAGKYARQLELGAYINFYMFCGGTNFGFMSGALEARYNSGAPVGPIKYVPFGTSYDVDAPVTENGRPTQKYFECKKVLRSYLEKHFPQFVRGNDVFDESAYPYRTQSVRAELNRSADLFSNIDNIAQRKAKSAHPMSFEDLGQAYGYVLYTTYIKYVNDREVELILKDVKDRACVYADGEYIGTVLRDRENPHIRIKVPKDGVRIDILAENQGRVSYGHALNYERKGIGELFVRTVGDDGNLSPHEFSFKSGWTNTSLPMKNLENLDYTKSVKKDCPAFFGGEFDAEPGVDTFLDVSSWKKGFVVVNGFNLGRYWQCGPQGTLYVPGELLREHNTITVFEMHPTKNNETAEFVETPNLDTLDKTVDLF